MSEDKMLNAATVIIPIVEGSETVVAISRPDEPTRFGLPGGKQDPGESILETAVREIKEELNVTLTPDKLVKIYTAPCEGEVDYNVTAFLYIGDVTDQTIVPEEGLVCKYIKLEELSKPEVSPFSDYNSELLDTLRKIRK